MVDEVVNELVGVLRPTARFTPIRERRPSFIVDGIASSCFPVDRGWGRSTRKRGGLLSPGSMFSN